jgi:steroid Delta-isomerase
MTATSAQVRAWAERYLDVANRRDPDVTAALYAPDATIEDPVGHAKHEGRDAIRGMYSMAAEALTVMQLRRTSPISVAANHAAFALSATIELAGVRSDIDVVSVMHFDDDGLITSMRAFWNFDDARPLGR